MMRRMGLWIVTCLVTMGLAWPAAAGAVCLTEFEGLASSDQESFGKRANGTWGWVGQQFTTDCDGKFLTVRFQISLNLLPVAGVDPLVGGDTVFCTVMDDQFQDIASVEAVLAGGLGPQWVEFDFGVLDVGLAAGLLAVRIETSLPAFANVITGSDVAPGRLLIGDDANIFASDVRDTAFRVTWDPDAVVVSIEEQSWSAVKALYR